MASGERTVKSGGCPGASGQDANRIAGVSGPGWRAGGATTSPSKLKSLTQNPRPRGVGRPCYEAENSACRGEWRRETGSPRRAPNAGPGKRAWRTPIPHLSLSDRKVGQGLIVFPFHALGTNPRPSANPHLPDPLPSHPLAGGRCPQRAANVVVQSQCRIIWSSSCLATAARWDSEPRLGAESLTGALRTP